MVISLLEKAGKFRFHYLAYLGLLFFFINFAVRLTLQVGFPSMLPFSADILPGLARGAINDFATLVFVLLPPAALILLPTDKFLRRRIGKAYAVLILFVSSSIFIFTAFAEYFFWDEFSSRFNFITVDYLIYTTEVMRNIIESYPLGWLLFIVFLLAVIDTALFWTRLRRIMPERKTYPGEYIPGNGSLFGRLGLLTGLSSAAIFIFFFFTPLAGGQNRFWNEYAKNGVYELFSAYRNNQLDYRAFYPTISSREAFSLLQAGITDANEIFEPARGENLLRMVKADAPEKKPNVIIVIMESMGSKWLGDLTPNLNNLAENGLAFTNMLSTGTRTVRGLEAVMLSVPPTPGNSIVRRPDNAGLFSLGSVFRRNGYDLDFIYGGIGYFDNMNVFFEGNGYTVWDKLDFSSPNKTFSNAWGQCDEDLYSESMRLADRSFQAGKPFQQVLLTTSNHRPFTFPEGRIDMEQGSRRAAINYSDYALGKFMDEAREKPWFEDTVFVFVGDHPSSIAGKTELPADAYGIVCVMYGPRFYQPEKVETLCSQIDVAPTLLATLGWEYRSQFFGTDARKLPEAEGRAWISTYQLLGFRTNDRLVILTPDGKAGITHLGAAPSATLAGDLETDAVLISKTIAYYQCAYDLFTHQRMRESIVASYTPMLRQVGKRNGSQGTQPENLNGDRQKPEKYSENEEAKGKAGLLAFMLLTAASQERAH